MQDRKEDGESVSVLKNDTVLKNDVLQNDTAIFIDFVDCSNNVCLKPNVSFVSNVCDDVVVNPNINGPSISKCSLPRQVK